MIDESQNFKSDKFEQNVCLSMKPKSKLLFLDKKLPKMVIVQGLVDEKKDPNKVGW